jgi:hypothetical protein
MIKLTTIFRKVFGQVDNKCAHCKADIQELTEKGIGKGKVLIINPDYNCYGNITHYHVSMLDLRERVDREFLEQIYELRRKHFE